MPYASSGPRRVSKNARSFRMQFPEGNFSVFRRLCDMPFRASLAMHRLSKKTWDDWKTKAFHTKRAAQNRAARLYHKSFIPMLLSPYFSAPCPAKPEALRIPPRTSPCGSLSPEAPPSPSIVISLPALSSWSAASVRYAPPAFGSQTPVFPAASKAAPEFPSSRPFQVLQAARQIKIS